MVLAMEAPPTPSCHASTVLPQTLILDPSGIVTYNREGSLSYEELAELIAAAKP